VTSSDGRTDGPLDDRLVVVDVVDGIATLTLDSVANRNALSGRLVAELLDAIEAATADQGVHALVITGAGTVFCSGADLADPPSNASGNRFSYPDVLQAIIACPKPVIAKVNGHARAGGLGLIAACDISIAPSDATFAFTEVRLGLVPAIIAVVCRRVMDARAFSRLALVGETFDAAEAVTSGLLTRAVARDELEGDVAALLGEIHRTEPNAVATTKRLLDDLAAMSVAEGFAHAAAISAAAFDSPEGREGIAAFRDKRRPAWTW
jgi:enoyl-CoA hydratase/carnithine racemase